MEREARGIEELLAERRNAVLDNSPQLLLGQIIEKLEAIEDRQYLVYYDFEFAFPTILDSWRGSYCELALGFDFNGYGGSLRKDPAAKNADELIEHLRSGIGETYTGWKGGEFKMNENTPVWVSNPGNNGHTAIVDVQVRDYRTLLLTQYCQF